MQSTSPFKKSIVLSFWVIHNLCGGIMLALFIRGLIYYRADESDFSLYQYSDYYDDVGYVDNDYANIPTNHD